MNLGDTYRHDHLWVVSSLRGADGSVVVLNFTSWRLDCDENCVIELGEHPFVKHKTVVAYEKARLLDPQAQAFIIKNPGLCPPMDPVSSALLARIQNGALVSDLTPQKIQAIIKDSMARQSQKKKK